MAIKSICYRRDTGVVVTSMPTDHIWSAIEQGLKVSATGIEFAVINMDCTDAECGVGVDYDESHDPCIPCGELKVDDVDNPTSLVEV